MIHKLQIYTRYIVYIYKVDITLTISVVKTVPALKALFYFIWHVLFVSDVGINIIPNFLEDFNTFKSKS